MYDVSHQFSSFLSFPLSDNFIATATLSFVKTSVKKQTQPRELGVLSIKSQAAFISFLNAKLFICLVGIHKNNWVFRKAPTKTD